MAQRRRRLAEGRRHFPAGSERRSSLFGGYPNRTDAQTNALPRPRATPTRLDLDPNAGNGSTPQAWSDAEHRRTKRGADSGYRLVLQSTCLDPAAAHANR